jgi:hypothetical protein
MIRFITRDLLMLVTCACIAFAIVGPLIRRAVADRRLARYVDNARVRAKFLTPTRAREFGRSADGLGEIIKGDGSHLLTTRP